MAQWGKTDTTGDSVLWGVSQLEQTANTENRDALYNNTTADQYFTGATHSQKAFDTTETAVAGAGVAHSGWVLETIGSGGRAGRVHREVLVAMGSITGDSGGDLAIVITTQPGPSFSGTNGVQDLAAVFGTVVAVTNPAGGSLTYQWEQSDDGTTGWANVSAVTGVDYGASATTPTLTVNVTNATNDINNASNNQLYYRLKISVAGGTDTFTNVVSITLS